MNEITQLKKNQGIERKRKGKGKRKRKCHRYQTGGPFETCTTSSWRGH